MADNAPPEKPLDDAIAELAARAEHARMTIRLQNERSSKRQQEELRRAQFEAAIVVVKEVVSRVLSAASTQLRRAGHSLCEADLQNRLRDDNLGAIPHFASMAFHTPGVDGRWLVMFGVESKDVYRDRLIYFYSGPVDVRTLGEHPPDRIAFNPMDRHVTEAWISALVGGAISRFAQMPK